MSDSEQITSQAQILKFQQDQPAQQLTEQVAREELCQIILNDKLIATIACSPTDLRELAAGFLFSEGIVGNIDSVAEPEKVDDGFAVKVLGQLLADEDALENRILTSGCAGGRSLAQNKLSDEPDEDIRVGMFVRISRQELLSLNKQMDSRAEVFHQTGGVHSASLCRPDRIIFRTDDIGRHNAADKVIGWAKLNGMDLHDKLLLATGRISSDIALKALRVGITIVASRAAPTSRALAYAQRMGLTVIGFARGKRMSVYTWPNRCSG